MIMSDEKFKNEIDWIGSIPHGWNSNRAKYLFALRTSKGNSFSLKLLTPSQIYGVIPQEEYERLTSFKTVKLKEGTDLKQFRTVHKGDFCISLRSFQGGFEFSTYEGVVSPAYQIFYPVKKVCGRYYKYLFKVEPFINKINSLTLSLRDGKNISFFDFGNIRIPKPNLEVQEKIANFLDSKCTEIDSLVADIQKEISILEDYKISVITEATIKGLDPTVEMKKTDVDCFEAIPTDWNVSKIKYVSQEVNDSGLMDPDTDSYIGLENLLPYSENLVSSDSSYLLSTQKKCHKGNVLFSKLRPYLAKSTVLKKDSYATSEFIELLPKKCEARYLRYCLLNNIVLNKINLSTYGSKMPRASSDFILNQYICFPELNEQIVIADYLENKCSEIDQIISVKQSQLEVLAEYKKSLIYEYVTGKKEVI